MNYELYQDSITDPIFIGSFDVSVEFRPRLGDHLSLPLDNRIFKVVRVSPSDNPEDEKVIYYVEEYVENTFSQFNIIVQDDPPGFR